MDVETSLEPPPTDEDRDDNTIHVHISINEADGTSRSASTFITGDDDDALADAILACLRGVASMRGTGLQIALGRKTGGLL